MLERLPADDPKTSGLFRSLSLTNFANALIAFLFSTSAPVAIVLAAGAKGGLSSADLSSWIFGAFALNSVFALVASLLYRMPLAFFWTIPGTVLVGDALGHLTFQEVIGAYIATGLLMMALGLTGWIRFVMDRIPMPIIMAMVAAVFLKFGLNWVAAFKSDFLITASMTAAFVVVSASERLQRYIRPMIAVLIVGCIALVVSDQTPTLASLAMNDLVVKPTVYMPVFSVQAIAELTVPLMITVVAANNAQGIAILKSRDYKPPVNTITFICGIASLCTAVVGCVSTCLTGPSTGIMVSGGERSKHFGAALFLALLSIAFGIFAPLFVQLMLGTPGAFIATLAGLALLRVLQDAFRTAFQQSFTLGALVTFMVTLADQAIFGIGAAFWGLVFGVLTSWLVERRDFSALKVPA